MTASAVLMMIVSILILWGGLVAAVVNVSRSDSKAKTPPMRDL